MKLYDDLAPWWPLLSPPEEYADEAPFHARTLQDTSQRPIRSLLELGSGGGCNAFHLKQSFEHLTLVDLSPGMLEVSRRLNPECEHLQGDMRTVRLQRRFDAVFVHDAVCYMTSEHDLRRAIETAAAHCRPGGAVLFAPDYVRETFEPGSDHGGVDGDGGRGLRYLEWVWDPDPDDTTYTVDYAYLLRHTDGHTEAVQDRHVEGLFPRSSWLQWMTEAGLTSRRVPFPQPDTQCTVEIFVGLKHG